MDTCPRIWYPGDQVAVIRNGYPVTGVIEIFVPVHGSVAVVAIVRVSQDAGLYARGDLITVPVAELKAVA